MSTLIVAFPKIEEAKAVRNLLVRKGYDVRRRRKLRSQPRRRSPQEQKIIDDAKAILMERNNMSEPEAFRYIQKCSMDSGNTMVESAQMVISIYDGG